MICDTRSLTLCIFIYCLAWEASAISEITKLEDADFKEISQEEEEKQTRAIVFEREIREFFESLSQLLLTGNEQIPSFDPLEVPDFSIHSDNELIAGDLHLRNIQVSGIPYFELVEGYIDYRILQGNGDVVVQLHFPELKLVFDYESQLKMLGSVNLPAEGSLSVTLSGFDIRLLSTAKLTILPPRLTEMTTLNMDLILPTVLLELTGFLKDDCLSELISPPLSDIISQFLSQQQTTINEQLNIVLETIKEIINTELLPFPSREGLTHEELLKELRLDTGSPIQIVIEKEFNKLLELLKIHLIENEL